MKPQYNQNPSTPQNDTGTLLSSNLYYYLIAIAKFFFLQSKRNNKNKLP